MVVAAAVPVALAVVVVVVVALVVVVGVAVEFVVAVGVAVAGTVPMSDHRLRQLERAYATEGTVSAWQALTDYCNRHGLIRCDLGLHDLPESPTGILHREGSAEHVSWCEACHTHVSYHWVQGCLTFLFSDEGVTASTVVSFPCGTARIPQGQLLAWDDTGGEHVRVANAGDTPIGVSIGGAPGGYINAQLTGVFRIVGGDTTS